MAINYDKNSGLISIETAHTSYQMLADKKGYLLHLYYGKKITGSAEYLLTFLDHGFSGNPDIAGMERVYSLDAQPQEYPFYGSGDYRSVCFRAKGNTGADGVDLRFVSAEITDGKYELENLPSSYTDNASGEGVQTLKITLQDKDLGLKVDLLYGIFPENDVITRSVLVTNESNNEVKLEKVQSLNLDCMPGDRDVMYFHGRHEFERQPDRMRVGHAKIAAYSGRGGSSHQFNPFAILMTPDADEKHGEAVGVHFVYSGNFLIDAEKDQNEMVRLTAGLPEEGFEWILHSGETFTAPEAVMTYSESGLGLLSRRIHRFFRQHICRGAWRDKERPILINNWEATYFTFDGDKIVDIASQAKELGVEMMVLDDGWFGKREDDLSGLGDWVVNEKKLKGTMKDVADRVNALDMKFGLWFEPEAVSEDSDLYRAHPDWAFKIPNKPIIRGRHELILDFSRKEVVDHIFEMMREVLDNANIIYVKWDFNRSIADFYSAELPSDRQGEVAHRYVLGVYDLLERLRDRYPELLIEGCSGGGGRFDAGMLCYTPQIWCSDNTDAIERIHIQYGTSFGYPSVTVGAHVSAVPNHQTGRVTPFNTRGTVAMSGSFGYELNLGLLSDEEKHEVTEQIALFKKYRHVIHTGDMYRLTNPQETDALLAAWMFVAEDKSEALLNLVTLNVHGNLGSCYINLEGLDEDASYRDETSGIVYTGSQLMNAGYPVRDFTGEYQARQVHFIRL